MLCLEQQILHFLANPSMPQVLVVGSCPLCRGSPLILTVNCQEWLGSWSFLGSKNRLVRARGLKMIQVLTCLLSVDQPRVWFNRLGLLFHLICPSTY